MGSSHRRTRRPRRSATLRGGAQNERIEHHHLRTLREAGRIIRRLDQELASSLGRSELLQRAVRECADANQTVSKQLRNLSERITAKKSVTPAVRAAMTSSTKVQKLAGQLSKTLEETQMMRQQLRDARNELGEARDTAARAHTETAELREELKKAGAARAEAALRPLVAQIDALEPRITAVADAMAQYRAGVNWRNWQPQRGNLGAALLPLYDALGEDFDARSTTNVTAAPEAIQNAVAAIAQKFQESIPPALEANLQNLQRGLIALKDTVTASLRAVERMPAAAGGRRRHKTHRCRHRR